MEYGLSQSHAKWNRGVRVFQVHGWAVVTSDTYEINSEADAELLTALAKQTDLVQTTNIKIHLDIGLNGDLHVLSVAGHKNHRYEPVIDLFRWLAVNGPGSYGLLYVLDDEDYQDGDYTNEFRVWRLARGMVEEQSDPFLSPPIPVLEDPYDPAREQ